MAVEIDRTYFDTEAEWLPFQLEMILMEVLAQQFIDGELMIEPDPPPPEIRERLMQKIAEERQVHLYPKNE